MDKEEFREKLKKLSDEIIDVVDEFEQDSKAQYKVKKGSFEWAIANAKAGNITRRKCWKRESVLSISTLTIAGTKEIKIFMIGTHTFDKEAWMPTINDFHTDDWEIRK